MQVYFEASSLFSILMFACPTCWYRRVHTQSISTILKLHVFASVFVSYKSLLQFSLFLSPSLLRLISVKSCHPLSLSLSLWRSATVFIIIIVISLSLPLDSTLKACHQLQQHCLYLLPSFSPWGSLNQTTCLRLHWRLTRWSFGFV